ncbi:C-type lectin domain 17 member A [Mactra antiquata]
MLHRFLLICFVWFGSGHCDDVSECFDGWVAYEGSCYLFGHDAVPFAEAKHFCEQHHQSYLVNIGSADENNFLKAYLRGLKHKVWWMGLSDHEKEGEWKWVNTDTVAEFTDWDPSQPDPSEEDCGVFWLAFDFRWGDVPCTSNFTPVCEMGTQINTDIIG